MKNIPLPISFYLFLIALHLQQDSQLLLPGKQQQQNRRQQCYTVTTATLLTWDDGKRQTLIQQLQGRVWIRLFKKFLGDTIVTGLQDTLCVTNNYGKGHEVEMETRYAYEVKTAKNKNESKLASTLPGCQLIQGFTICEY